MRTLITITLAAGCAGLLASGRAAASVIDTVNFSETTFVADVGPSEITGMAWAPDGSDRLFLTAKGGSIVIVKNGAVLPQPFATLDNVFTNSECGLLSIAFDPNFMDNELVYVFVTVEPTPGTRVQRVVRFRAQGDLGVDETIVYDSLPTRGENHDGGALVFGPDGMMYWAIGNLGGSGTGMGDDKVSLASKIARARPVPNGPAPEDNPFFDGGGPNNDLIWARGFRNPFTMSVQPSTGLLWVNVVGDNYEQVFVIRRGDHVGYPAENANPGGLVTVSPVIKYRVAYAADGVDQRTIAGSGAVRSGGTTTFTTTGNHNLRKGERVFISGVGDASFDTPAEGVPVASIVSGTQLTIAQAGGDASSGGGTLRTAFIGNVMTGGTHYDGTQFPAAYRGNYFFGDLGSGRFYRVPLDGNNLPADVEPFGQRSSWIDAETGPDGALYVATHGGGVFRIAHNSTALGISVSRLNTRIAEGGRGVIMVSLTQAPASNVTVTAVRSGGDADVTIDGASALTFTPQNWDVPRAIEIAAAEDDDTAQDVATIELSAGGAPTETATVFVTDSAGQTLPPLPDAGVSPDASLPAVDAGARDAGTRDAATRDAALTDGGARDAAAAGPDARRSDGGTSPSGDAGMGDGGDSGCGCRTDGSRSAPGGGLIALIAAAFLLRRRARHKVGSR